MPAYDDDRPPPRPPAPGRPAAPAPSQPAPYPKPAPYTPDGLTRGGRRRLVPLESLYGWVPDPDVVENLLAGVRPPGAREVPCA